MRNQPKEGKQGKDLMANLDARGIEDGVLAGPHGEEAGVVVVVDDAAEGADDLGGGLKASEEGGNEDAVDGEADAAQPLTGSPRPDQAPLGERRVPRTARVRHPQRLQVVDPVPVPHHQHVLNPPFSFSPSASHCSRLSSDQRKPFLLKREGGSEEKLEARRGRVCASFPTESTFILNRIEPSIPFVEFYHRHPLDFATSF
ncbi:hypothetical protein BHM03_00013602 [Ensete ventricosum]|nr:hypothetical protein BHM03_00013602 [Ensete ventricosum]